MPVPEGWRAAQAIAACAIGSWHGRVWRGHADVFQGTDWRGSLIFSGRFNRGQTEFPDGPTWPALYLALNRDAVLGEIARHFLSDIPPRLGIYYAANPAATPSQMIEQVRTMLAGLNNRRISEIAVELSAVLDCRDVTAIGLTPPHIQAADLFHDTDYSVGQELAAATIARGCEAIIVPSATGFGDNLIVFPDSLKPGSSIELVQTTAHRLFIDRK